MIPIVYARCAPRKLRDAQPDLRAEGVVIQRPELLGHWLYRVAYRIGRKARRVVARRLRHERTAVASASAALRSIGITNLRFG